MYESIFLSKGKKSDLFRHLQRGANFDLVQQISFVHFDNDDLCLTTHASLLPKMPIRFDYAMSN
jgi:hypothetical protein